MSNPYKTITTKSRILIYLRARQPSYLSGTELESQAREWGTKASVISRRCRELEQEGRIQKMYSGKCVWYRLTQSEPRIAPKPVTPNKLFEIPVKRRYI